MRLPRLDLSPAHLRLLRVAGSALLAVGGLVLVALAAFHLIAASPQVRERLRARLEDTLRAKLGPVYLDPSVRTEWPLKVSFGPVAIPSDCARGRPFVWIDRVRARPDLVALFRGRLEPASVRLYGVRVAFGCGEGEQEADDAGESAEKDPGLETGAATADPPQAQEGAAPRSTPRALPRVYFRDLSVTVPVSGRILSLGPVDGAVFPTREAERAAATVELQFKGGGQGLVTLEKDAAGVRSRVLLERLSAEALPESLRQGAVVLTRGTVSLEADLQASADLKNVSIRAQARGRDLVLLGARLAPEPVGPLRFDASGELAWDGGERRLRLRDGRLDLLDALRLELSAEARVAPRLPFAVSLRAPSIDYQALVAALPPSLAPSGDVPQPEGTFSAQFELFGPLTRPEEWELTALLDLASMREAARKGTPVSLRKPFVHVPALAEGDPPTVMVGPSNPHFVPIAELPQYVVRAVTTSEDAGFFAHQGFDFQELKNAFVQGTQAGHVVRGASTISQQLAKNLFLSREKTLARKAREALLTIALEATVPKQRLMEIYLNIAEWGPGIWGLGPAARHWFGKDARLLTPKEAAFLASVIPNPVLYHSMYTRGALTEAWEQRVDDLLVKMVMTGVLTEEDLIQARMEPIIFAKY